MKLRVWMVAGLCLLASAGARAQEDAPPMAMGGGRMIRGTVTAATPDRLTVKTEGGEVFQVILTPNTQVRKGREQMKVADVHVGDGVGAMGVLDAPNKTVHAMYIGVVDAEQARKLRESLGKTWIAGKVTAIDDVKLTILRSDNVTQVITVDDDTSFRKGGRGMRAMMDNNGGPMPIPEGMGQGGGGGQRGQGGGQGAQGEPITLADIKVGDSVAGQGSLKGGVFVPTELRVGDAPPAGGRRRRNQDGTGAPAGPATPNGAPQ